MLALSTLAHDDEISITQTSTGRVEKFPVHVTVNREVPLWAYHLEPDHYEVSHGEWRIDFQIVDGIAESAGPGAGSVHLRGTVMRKSSARRPQSPGSARP